MKKLLIALVIASPLGAMNAEAYRVTTGTLEVNHAFTITRTLANPKVRRDGDTDELLLTPGKKKFQIAEDNFTNIGPCVGLIGCFGDRSNIEFLRFSLIDNKKPKGADPILKVLAQVDSKAPAKKLRNGSSAVAAEDSGQSFSIYQKTFESKKVENYVDEVRSCSETVSCDTQGAQNSGLLFLNNCHLDGTQNVKAHDAVVTTHMQAKFIGSRNETLGTYTGTYEDRREIIDEASECNLER